MKRALIILLIIILANAGFLGMTFVFKKRINKNTFVIEEEITKLNKKHLEIDNLRDNLQQIKNIDEDISIYEKYLFTKGNELDLIEDLENLAIANKVTQKIVTHNIDNKKSEILEITLSIDGLYSNAIKYLYDLENYDYFINIERIELLPKISTALETSLNNPSVNMRLKISLYAKNI